ncbi:MAG: phosphatidylserine decarboxylase [Thermoplasmatota archaeon]
MRLAKGMPNWLVIMPALSLVCLLIYALWVPSFPLLIISPFILAVHILMLLFFRDPDRSIGEGIVSPADGRIVRIERSGRDCFVSIFMNVHNVHVNRSPGNASVLSVQHIPGGYAPAFSKESDSNERVITRLRAENGIWEMTQIAGTVARRIVPYWKEGDLVLKGQRIGMIRFGSRVDLSFKMPRGMDLCVDVGEKVKAGSSSLAVPARSAPPPGKRRI